MNDVTDSQKRQLYGKYGVKEYWVVDFEKRTIEVYLLQEQILLLQSVLAEKDENHLFSFTGIPSEGRNHSLSLNPELVGGVTAATLVLLIQTPKSANFVVPGRRISNRPFCIEEVAHIKQSAKRLCGFA